MDPWCGVAAVTTVNAPVPASMVTTAATATRRTPKTSAVATTTVAARITQRSGGNHDDVRPSRITLHTPVTATSTASTTRAGVWLRPRHSSHPAIATSAATAGASATA
jgi:hypothetical protein